jgi:endonuclease/exonuclease/phosphatase family metal-dependent hydrolase
VLLWSRAPWREVDVSGDPALPPGRYIAGRTTTTLGEVTVIGVCIPWRDAHVSSGRRDREPWQDHCAYLAGLARIVARSSGPLIVVGDFNQRVPRTRAPLRAFAALETALGEKLRIVTAGPLPPLAVPVIDHVALSPDLAGAAVVALDNRADDGRLVSDHFGVAISVMAAPVL